MEDLSVVIPVYNNADVLTKELPHLIECLQRQGMRWSIIVSDDGSPCVESVKRVSRRFGCHLVRGERNQGKGAAVRRGMLAARGRFRLFTDADIPFELAELESFLSSLAAGESDLVCGERRAEFGGDYFTRISRLRRVGSGLFSRVTASLVPDAGPDTQCGLKAFTDVAAEDLFRRSRIDRYAFDVELLYLAAKLGYRVARAPVTLRSSETSQVNLLRDGARMIYDLLRISLHDRLGGYAPSNANTLLPARAA